METIELTQTYMQRMFADAVSIEHFEMSKAGTADLPEVKALLEQVPEGYLYYPLVYIDDTLEIVGSAQYYEIFYAVKKALGPTE